MTARYFLFLLTAIAAMGAPPLYAQRWPDPHEFMGLEFVSRPPEFARAGIPYVYTAVARSMDPTAVIHYRSALSNPIGFAIDSVTGVVTWTPPVRGWYEIHIIAHSDKGERGEQRFVVTVTNGNGVVQGEVQDTMGVGIPGILVQVVQAWNIMSIGPGCFRFSAVTDSNGNYRIANIEPGIYKLHAVSPTPMYESQWYDGKSSPEEANRITIPDTPSATIANFTLRAGPGLRPTVTVSGSVTDTTFNALKNAGVWLVRAGFALNNNGGPDDFRDLFDLRGSGLDFRMRGFAPHVFRTRADSLGHYSLKVPVGTYVAFAHAQGYATEFYLHEPNLLKADKLVLGGDTTGIDFTLAPLPPVAYGSISGSVLDTVNDVGVRSRIIAMRDEWTVPNLYPVSRSYTVDTDSLGAYTLDELLPGAYIIFALPVGNYAPAFYTNDTSTTSWHRASRVYIDGNSVTGIDIYVHQIPTWAHGYTGISGTITMSSGPVSGAAGTVVYASTSAGVAGYDIADALGRYSIQGLAPGTYTVSADLPGTTDPPSQSATVSYSSMGAPVNAVVNLGLTVVTGVVDPSSMQPETFSLAQNYPNPFNPSTKISYQISKTGHVDLRVYDLLGREVAVLVDGVQEVGAHSVTFGGTSLASGVYLYRLTYGSMSATRKMVLMK